MLKLAHDMRHESKPDQGQISAFRLGCDVILDDMSEPDAGPASLGHRERMRESQCQARRLLMRWDPSALSGIPRVSDNRTFLM